MMLLSKSEASISPRFKKFYKQHRSEHIQRNRDDGLFAPPVDSGEMDHYGSLHNVGEDYNDPYVAAGYSSVDSSASASSHWSNASGFSNTSKRVKRKRQPAAFECTHPGCTEKFDRWCDLNHHSRVHLAYEQRPYPCEQCDKRFLFPKDLRRHETTHATRNLPSSYLTDSERVDCMPEHPRAWMASESCGQLEKEQEYL